MYPFNVILVGCTQDVRNAIWPELVALNCHIEAEFLGVESALEALRSGMGQAGKGGKGKEQEPMLDERRLFVVHLEKPVDLMPLKRLSSMFASSPIVAIFDSSGNPALAITAMRTGATQVVLMPIQPEDFRTAMQCISMQSGAETTHGQVIALAGVTGGAGTTTIAINLANEMGHLFQQRVILAELSFLVGKFPVYLDLEPRHTIHELIQEIRRLDVYFVKSALLPMADNENVMILPGPFQPVGAINIQPADVLYLCDFLRQLADFVILDVPCTYDNIFFETLNAADQIVMVAEQKVPSVRSLQMIFNNLRHKQPHLLLNRYDPNIKGFGVQRLQELLQVPRMLTITNDYDSVTSAVNQGKTLRAENPRSKALTDIDALAKVLVPNTEGTAPVPSSGMFKGLMKAFGFKK
jgi:pilus assembly protein CpaE